MQLHMPQVLMELSKPTLVPHYELIYNHNQASWGHATSAKGGKATFFPMADTWNCWSNIYHDNQRSIWIWPSLNKDKFTDAKIAEINTGMVLY